LGVSLATATLRDIAEDPIFDGEVIEVRVDGVVAREEFGRDDGSSDQRGEGGVGFKPRPHLRHRDRL